MPRLLSWCALAAAHLLPAVAALSLASDASLLAKRDGHGHHHGAPLLELNETEVTLYHAPTPPSYYTIDWEDADPSAQRYPGLIITHAVLMSLAFFVALPMGIAMRSVKHAWHGAVIVIFYGLCVLGCAASALYKKLTPDMYEGSAHGKQGYLIFALAATLSTIDIYNLIFRVVAFFRSDEKFQLKTFWCATILGRDSDKTPDSKVGEYAGLVTDEPEELDEVELASPTEHAHKHVHYDIEEEDVHHDTAQWANNVHRHRREDSHGSDATLFRTRSSSSDDTLQDSDVPHQHSAPRQPLLRRIGVSVFATLERTLVVAGLFQLVTGIVIYTGGCRENYLNGCLAHLIKGGIFWCYGLLTFARFLGSYSEYGWAWNRSPTGGYRSAEFVESALIFTYGITNTWMERFGAKAGDPFTTKQIQHIGIAVMFWFAGLVGMAIESKTLRRWVASSTTSALKPSQSSGHVAEPPSYTASFNPFPALVIGITGAAMAAHAQTYLFQVQIHQLWGNLLVGFSVMRCITYFFLWLGPPKSILPSRPPTEALASFFVACGGLMFTFSTEEVTIAAMRRGRDDMMMFLNVAVAVTCCAFCWVIAIVGFKGWLKSRTNLQLSFNNTP